jgi:protein disulfide-isomerase A6
MVAFYAPWCGHCHNLAPAYKKAAENLNGLVSLAAVDCDADKNKQLCAQHDIRGFPTIKVFPGKPKRSPKGTRKETPEEAFPFETRGWLTRLNPDYNGPRTAKAIVDYMLDVQPSRVKKGTTPDSLSSLLSASVRPPSFPPPSRSDADFIQSKPLAILLSTSSLPKPLYKALSTDLHESLDFHILRDTRAATDIKARLGLDASTKPPMLVVWQDGNAERYEGQFQYAKLKRWLEDVASGSGKRARGKTASDEL